MSPDHLCCEPAQRCAGSSSRGVLWASRGAVTHRLRLLPLGDDHAAAKDGDGYAAREYHPYGLMVWGD